MVVKQLAQFKRGWIIGAFKPSLIPTTLFEVAIKRHRKGEAYHAHYQHCAKEYNVLLHGRLRITQRTRSGWRARTLSAGAIFIIEAGEITKPIFLTNCEVVCVKVPSLPGDKVVVERT